MSMLDFRAESEPGSHPPSADAPAGGPGRAVDFYRYVSGKPVRRGR